MFIVAMAVLSLIVLPMSANPTFAHGGTGTEEQHSFSPVVPPRPPAPHPQSKVKASTKPTPRVGRALQALPNHAKDPVDLKLLVIAAQSNESVLDAIQFFLSELGVPYDTLIASQTPLVSSMLWDGISHGYYQGVLLTTGSLVYDNASVSTSAFTAAQWQTLWDYEIMFGVRQVTWFTDADGFPDNYGLNPVSEVDTAVSPLQAQLTADGQNVFPYLNRSAVIPLADAYTYLATVISPTETTPLVVTPNGFALASIHRYPDGRQNLAITASHSRYSLHSILFSYGVINWVTKGLFQGERHVSLDLHADDLLFGTVVWDTVALTNTTGLFYRLTGADLDTALAWQTGIQSSVPNAAGFTIEFPFNGKGAVPDTFPGDTLTPRVISNKSHFNFVSHTFDHPSLDAITSTAALAELTNNDAVAANQLQGLNNYYKDVMVQPAITGLNNPDFQSAAVQYGIKYMVSNTYAPGWNNPSPNAGIYSSFQPSILIVPRHPFNLWYDNTTPANWTSEYNYYYGPQGTHYPYWSQNQTYSQIIDNESNVWLRYLLNWDIDPLEFHQSNLLPYDGTHSILGDLLGAALAKYNALYNLPIRNVYFHQLAGLMANRMTYNASGARGTWTRCSSLTLSTTNAALIPVTGVQYGSNTEQYGGQTISYIQLGAGGGVTLPTSNAPCQTITFAGIANRTVLDQAFSISATASSGLPVSFTASGSCIIAGTLVSPVGLGSCTITAHQGGNTTYDPAPDVQQTFSIKANTAIAVSSSANPSVIGKVVTLSARVTSLAGTGLSSVTPTGTVSFAIDGAVAGSSPVDANGVASITTSGLGGGIHHVIATYGGDGNLLGASASFDEKVLGNLYLPLITRH